MATRKSTILIVTEELDGHADIIILKLREMGYEPIRLHTADIPLKSVMAFTFDSTGWEGEIRAGGRRIDFNDIRSIWWRRPRQHRFPPEIKEEEVAFARAELRDTLNGVWDSLDCYWMSFPHNIRLASYKPGQLKRAARLGFEIPRTLITTDPERAQRFYEECHGKMIYKVLSNPLLTAESLSKTPAPSSHYAVFTTPITAEHLKGFEAIRLAPCQFQEYIPKRYELRVTVIGEEVFAAEIHSQENQVTSIDWRHYEVEVPYKKGNLPPDVAERCHALTKGYGLNFSAIDLILTPDGRYVFLEINPNGQWFWLEEKVPELKLTAALASCLIRGKGIG